MIDTLTLGAAGAVGVLGRDEIRVAAARIEAIDTTGAGDAFVGAYAAALDAGYERRTSIRRASAARSLACTVRGAQPALPTRAAIDALLPSVTLLRSRRC
jgi:ribokinase